VAPTLLRVLVTLEILVIGILGLLKKKEERM
jgi:Tfp pilus assembly protein PilV